MEVVQINVVGEHGRVLGEGHGQQPDPGPHPVPRTAPPPQPEHIGSEMIPDGAA